MTERNIPAAISRRGFLARIAGLSLSGLVVGPVALLARTAGTRDIRPPLITRVSRPENLETPVSDFTAWLTPTERFFVRSHFGPPPSEQSDGWRLTVDGDVVRPLTLSPDDLARFPTVTQAAVLQCSGNGRAFFTPKTPGAQWEKGAVGNARWTGVRLRDVLESAGMTAAARHVQLMGADRPVLPTVPLFIRSMPIEKALHPATLLAYRMNDDALPLLHGGPLRLVTPGWAGDAWVKWLTSIRVQAQEADGYFMKTAYRMPATADRSVANGQRVDSTPIEAYPVKSLIAFPADGTRISERETAIQGVALTGNGGITRIEVSLDAGTTWHEAELFGPAEPYAWRQWRYPWRPARGTQRILSRATDSQGHVQPDTTPWNPGGYLWNGIDRVRVAVVG